MSNYVKPMWSYVEIIFSEFIFELKKTGGDVLKFLGLLCIIGAVVLASLTKESQNPVLQKSSIWFAFIDCHFILNLMIVAVSQKEVIF